MANSKLTVPCEELTAGRRRSLAIRLVLRSLVVAILLFVAYYTLPMNRPERGGLIVLIVGIAVLALVLLGLVAKLIFGAVEVALKKKTAAPATGAEPGAAG